MIEERPIMKVAFFPGCMVDMFYPEVGMAAVRVLEHLGCDVVLPDNQVCCGQPFFNSGYSDAAKPMMKNVIDAYQGYETIVSLTGSCAYAIKGEYQHFLENDDEYSRKLAAISSRIYEFTEFIVDVLGMTDVGAHLDGIVTYHKSCHLTRLLGIKEQPLQLIENIHGLSYVEMPEADRCCGFGGTFSVKEPEISSHIVQEKVINALATDADYLCGADQACLMNIKGRLDRMRDRGEITSTMKVVHIAQLLDLGMGK